MNGHRPVPTAAKAAKSETDDRGPEITVVIRP